MINLKNFPEVALKIIRAKLGQRIPFKVTQYLTYRCNLACKFCGRRLNVSPEMTTKQTKQCMKEFKQMGTMFWSFNGGEPLLRQDIGELIDYSKELGFKCSLVSNGLLVPKKINQIKNLDVIVISVDGPEEIHDQVRGRGVFKKTIKALKILKENNIETYILSVINKTNLDYLNDIWEISEKYDTHLEFQPVVIHGADKEKNALEYFPEKEKFLKTIDWLIDQKKQGRRLTNSFDYLNQLKYYPDSPIDIDCWASYLFCCITPAGYITPCSTMLSDYRKFQSGLEVGFKKAFYSLPDLKKCRLCYFSCYAEYNNGINSLTKTGLKFIRNMLSSRKTWFWQ